MHLWVKFAIQDAVLRVSRRKISKLFPYGASFACVFDEMFIKVPSYTNQAHSAPCVTLAYSQPCYILSPDVSKTGSLYKTLGNVDQAYSEPGSGTLSAIFRHI